MPNDRYGNFFQEPKQFRIVGDSCQVIDCPSNSGFTCALSTFDHPDSINPRTCLHKKFKERGQTNEY
jgi:hypothetical protein